MIEATLVSYENKVVFVRYFFPNIPKCLLSISGDLAKYETENGIYFQTMGLGASISFTAESVQQLKIDKNLAGQDCLFIDLKTTVEDWKRENA